MASSPMHVEFNRVDNSLYDSLYDARRGKWPSFQIFIDAY